MVFPYSTLRGARVLNATPPKTVTMMRAEATNTAKGVPSISRLRSETADDGPNQMSGSSIPGWGRRSHSRSTWRRISHAARSDACSSIGVRPAVGRRHAPLGPKEPRLEQTLQGGIARVHRRGCQDVVGRRATVPDSSSNCCGQLRYLRSRPDRHHHQAANVARTMTTIADVLGAARDARYRRTHRAPSWLRSRSARTRPSRRSGRIRGVHSRCAPHCSSGRSTGERAAASRPWRQSRRRRTHPFAWGSRQTA